jgi:hypothetical protein
MIRSIIITIVFTCVYAIAYTQVNFVKNPSFEEYSLCPDDWNQVYLTKNWRNATDSAMNVGMEFYHTCGNLSLDVALHVPDNSSFWQNPRTGQGIVGAHFLYDKSSISPPPFPLPFNYRDYLQSHLNTKLINGKTYCVSFWVNLAEASGMGQNRIGAYLDNGAINLIADTAGEEITSIIPQVFTNTIIKDTMNWVKIEGSFVATGNETYITLGNFFKNADISTTVTNYRSVGQQYSYYLIDDVSVIPIDLAADAGKDTWVEQGKKVQIGRVGDTTAQGLDCKWYKMGVLIDSGAIITVNANSIINAVDAYVVVQNICGIIKRDTVNVKTTNVGIKEYQIDNQLNLYPNPSDGTITIKQNTINDKKVEVKVYNAIGSLVYQSEATFVNGQINVILGQKAQGVYLVCIGDDKERTTCLRFIIN